MSAPATMSEILRGPHLTYLSADYRCPILIKIVPLQFLPVYADPERSFIGKPHHRTTRRNAA